MLIPGLLTSCSFLVYRPHAYSRPLIPILIPGLSTSCLFVTIVKVKEEEPRGVVVSALTSHVRDPGFDSRAG